MEEQAKTVITGEITGNTNPEQMPDVACSKVKFRAQSGNSGNVYIGTSSNVTTPSGSTDQSTGFELDAGQDTGWLWIDNLNKLWRICDNNGDDLTYIAQV